MIDVLIRRGNFGHTQREHHVRMEAEVGVMQLQAEECQGLLVTTRS